MDIKNSKTLKSLLQRMDTYQTLSANVLNVECFWLAAIELYVGAIELDHNDQDALAVGKLINDAKIDADKAKRFLEKTIFDEYFNDYPSSIEFQIAFKNAKMFAQKLNRSEVNASDILKIIIDEKLGETSKILSGDSLGSVNTASENNGNVTAPVGSATVNNVGNVVVEEPKVKANPVFVKRQLADLSDKVKEIRDNLSDVVFGQEKAITTVATGYFQAVLNDMTDKNRTKPYATYLFAGPPGVGKTFLAEQFAGQLKLPFMRFDMSEYGDINAIQDFCGSDSVYRKSKEGDVTGFAARNPKSVILFDEIEKAHINIIHLFLQILDAGRIRDNFTGNEVLFKDIIIIFTTNAGKTLYESTDATDFSNVSRKVILKAIADDKKPGRDEAFFPAAICSRFATGNVIMFNQITAHNLISIAKREIKRNAEGFEREMGINVKIDDDVYAAILFAEGASADARTVKARAAGFFNAEIYELLRLMESDKITAMESIEVGVQLPENEDILRLFRGVIKPEILVFTTKETAKLCQKNISYCAPLAVSDIKEAKKLLKKKDIKFVVLDLMVGSDAQNRKYLNIEDINSPSRDLFKHLREYYKEMPLYLLESGEVTYSAEERISFFGQGVRDVITLGNKEKDLNTQVLEICKQHTYQNSMIDLAKSNKLIKYETAQTIEENGKKSVISLFDFAETLAMDAKDAKSVLSNISRPNITFGDVIGAEDAKDELKYFVEYLKNPKKYLGTGVRPPRGILLYGPPGTGKTLLAKALASESGVTFISAQGNQFLSKWIGEGPERMHEIFITARKYAPTVLFIDEIDTIGAERTGDATRSEEGVLTALLTEMDGFNVDASKPVFVLAATNYGVDEDSKMKLDGALLRRFDRKIYVDLPTSDERVMYLKKKIEGNPLFQISEEAYENIAVRSTGMSLANLENVIELAMRMVIRSGGNKVTDAILDEALEVSKYGEEKPWDKSLLESTARHEAGHAFLCWYGGEIPAYVTVVARGGHGGYMGHADKKGFKKNTRKDLIARIRTSLAGRAAELVYYGDEEGLSTGASADLENATYFATRIICSYGMDEEFGLAVVDLERTPEMLPTVRPLINKLLLQELENTKQIISQNKAAIDAMVEVLMTKNHLSGPEIDELFSKYAKMEQK